MPFLVRTDRTIADTQFGVWQFPSGFFVGNCDMEVSMVVLSDANEVCCWPFMEAYTFPPLGDSVECEIG